MWEIQNKTPFAAAGAMSQDYKTGATVWQVAIKATFDIVKVDRLAIAGEQVEVFSSPQYRDQEDNSSIVYYSDLEAQTKPAVDVVLNGHAYAQGYKQTTELTVGVAVGNWIKQLKVFGDRYWDKALGVIYQTDPEPFEKIPIVYENAFGGTDDATDPPALFRGNPVGTGFAAKSNHRVGQKLPQIEYPDHPTQTGKPAKNRVAGFGPLGSHWEPRVGFGGTYDQTWQTERFPLLPLDFDPRFFQCAPADQQLPEVNAGDPVKLLNLTPGGGYLECRIPDIEVDLCTRLGTKVIEHRPQLHTIIIEPDRPGLQLVWHSLLECHNRDHLLEQTLVRCRIKRL
jgi:hypothetical protein